MNTYNDNIDQDIITWYKTKDEALFEKKIYPVILNFSASIIEKTLGRTAMKEEVSELATKSYLFYHDKPFDPTKSNSPSAYLYHRIYFAFNDSKAKTDLRRASITQEIDEVLENTLEAEEAEESIAPIDITDFRDYLIKKNKVDLVEVLDEIGKEHNADGLFNTLYAIQERLKLDPKQYNYYRSQIQVHYAKYKKENRSCCLSGPK